MLCISNGVKDFIEDSKESSNHQIEMRPEFSLRVRDLDIANVLPLMEQCSMSRTQWKIELMAMQRSKETGVRQAQS
jgi:hypothetical protein